MFFSIISHTDVEQLLVVPNLFASTGEEMSKAPFNLLTERGIADKMVAACFDTTASNSGRWNGAAVLLEQLLRRNLLYLPCRHHGATSGTNALIFVRLKDSWNKIEQNNFKFGVTNDFVTTQLNHKKS